MRIEDYKRLRFVQNHDGWKTKLDKFLNAPEMERPGRGPVGRLNRDIDTFIWRFKDDIDKSINIIEEKEKL